MKFGINILTIPLLFKFDSSLIGENQYELSGFLRGRFGTEGKILEHKVGERFVLLDDKIECVELPNQLIGKTYQVKAVTFGALIEQDEQISEFTYNANSLRPYAPSHISLSDNKLKWIRRTRGVAELKDYVDIPLNEEKEQYLVEFQNKKTVRKYMTCNPELILSEEELAMLNDEEVSITVSQLSQSVGKGFSADFIGKC